MAHVIVRRGGGFADALRRYTVIVDGEPKAKLKSNSAAHLQVAEGIHSLQCIIDGWGSKTHGIFASLSNTVVVNCVQMGDPSRILKGREPVTSYLKLETEDPEDCAREYLRQCVHVARSKDQRVPFVS